MYAFTKTYVGFDDVQRTEEFIFRMTKPELLEWNASEEGGMKAYMEKIVNTNDQAKLVMLVKDLLLRSYGEKSADGRRFVKSPEISKAFSETPAYEMIYMDLVTDADLLAKFVEGIVPKMA